MTPPELEITEQWIRERIGLEHENLEDVKSLSLPGTYHQKIRYLGTSLQGFARLKSLDLSRNAITSLSGLSHLTTLEALNLYYNDIKSLKDLHLLKNNTNLQDLDLRLNPVTKNEVDYRLFVIHLLPNLRKLDDRSVRESERNAALLHFDTDQAFNKVNVTSSLRFLDSLPKAGKDSAMVMGYVCVYVAPYLVNMIFKKGKYYRKPTNWSSKAYDLMSHVTDQVNQKENTAPGDSVSRSEQMRKLARYPSALEDDDSDLIDLLAKAGGDINRPYPLSGSEAKSSDFQQHSKEDIRRMEKKMARPSDLRISEAEDRTPDSETPLGDQGTAGSFQISNTGQTDASHHAPQNGYSTYRAKGQVHFQDREEGEGSNGSRHDEYEAYTSYSSKGHFTPNPKAGVDAANKRGSRDRDQEGFKEPPQVQRLFEAPKEATEAAPTPVTKDASDELLLSLLHLVDRYWNGSKSLHYHSKFQAQARHIIKTAFLQNLANHQGLVSSPDERMRKLEEENAKLRGEAEERRKADGHQLHKELENGLWEAQEEVRRLQSKLQDSMEKNSLLQKQLLKTTEPNGMIIPASFGVDEDLRKEVVSLVAENDKLKFQIKHFKQLQELASMLQESHKSLVTTNDHLLKEMEELKKRHLQEVKQLHWSYGELKNSMNLISTADHNQNAM